VRLGTIKIVLLGQLRNVFFIMKLLATTYMVDSVLLKSENDKQSRFLQLLLLTAFTLLPQAVLHYLDLARCGWRVSGRTRLRVMAGLMNSFLYMRDDARMSVSSGDLVDAMTFDTDEVIKNGYMTLLSIVQLLGKIVVCLLFQLVAPLLSGSVAPSQLGIRLSRLVLFPLCTILLLLARTQRTQRMLSANREASTVFIAGVHGIVDNFRLFADFDGRNWAMDRHTENIGRYGASSKALGETLLNNQFLMKWLTSLVVASFVLMSGIDVIRGEMKCGMFLACLSVNKQVGALWSLIYSDCIKCVVSSHSLERIVSMINKPVDAKRRMELTAHMHEVGHRITGAQLAQYSGAEREACLDTLPIQVDNVNVALRSRAKGSGSIRTTELFFNGLQLHQGTLISFVGRHGEGKSTLLRIIGGALQPDPGDDSIFFVPLHLRVLHVPHDVMFVHGTLYNNLTLGVQPGTRDGGVKRVRRIAERCGLPPDLCKSIDTADDSPVLSWSECLSGTEKHLLVLARALVANPEVLCLHKPTLHLNDSSAEVILDLLREFVDNRGVCLDERTMHLRRPRTCILTSARPKTAQRCDEVFEIRGGTLHAAESRVGEQAVLRRGPSVLLFDPDEGVDLKDLAS